MAFVTPVVEHMLEREIAQWVHYERSIQRPITWANALTTQDRKANLCSPLCQTADISWPCHVTPRSRWRQLGRVSYSRTQDRLYGGHRLLVSLDSNICKLTEWTNNEWMNERMKEWTNECTNKQTNVRTNKRTNKQTNKRTNKQTYEQINNQTNECLTTEHENYIGVCVSDNGMWMIG